MGIVTRDTVLDEDTSSLLEYYYGVNPRLRDILYHTDSTTISRLLDEIIQDDLAEDELKVRARNAKQRLLRGY